MKNVKRGLIVGRFQPYHLGHHEAIKNALKEVEELIIVIGSANKSYTTENPFTAGERVEMIAKALKADKIFEKCFIIPLADIEDNALWVARVKEYTPKFEIVYTNNPLVKQLFEKEGFIVKPMVSYIKEVESKIVRQELMNRGSWENILPPAVADYLKEIKAVERLEAIMESEKKE